MEQTKSSRVALPNGYGHGLLADVLYIASRSPVSSRYIIECRILSDTSHHAIGYNMSTGAQWPANEVFSASVPGQQCALGRRLYLGFFSGTCQKQVQHHKTPIHLPVNRPWVLPAKLPPFSSNSLIPSRLTRPACQTRDDTKIHIMRAEWLIIFRAQPFLSTQRAK